MRLAHVEGVILSPVPSTTVCSHAHKTLYEERQMQTHLPTPVLKMYLKCFRKVPLSFQTFLISGTILIVLHWLFHFPFFFGGGGGEVSERQRNIFFLFTTFMSLAFVTCVHYYQLQQTKMSASFCKAFNILPSLRNFSCRHVHCYYSLGTLSPFTIY